MIRIINQSDICLPELFNEIFFVKLLKTISPEIHKFKIESVKFTRGSNDGENYFSKILRANIKYFYINDQRTKQEISIIMKYLPSDEKRPFGENLNFFSKEINMAEKIIPRFEQTICHEINLAPRHYLSILVPSRVMVFEDLQTLGYKLADRQIGIDEKHARIVLKKLAIFHAASISLAHQDPESMKMYDKGFFDEKNRNTTLQKNIFEGNLDCIAQAVANWPGFEEIPKKLQNIKGNFFERCLATERNNGNELKVLNHGDLQLNNFMFKYDCKKQPVDVIFLDFQMCHYASLGIDLNYFFNTSLQINALKNERYNLLKLYYDYLAKTLSKLNYSYVPSLKEVENEVRSKEFYGFFAFEGILPTISMHPDYCKKANVDKFSTDEILTWRRKVMFSTERYLETMKYSLKRFDDLGVLD